MEKIKTPLGQLIEELYKEREAHLKMMQPTKYFDIAINKAESLLQAERDMIEKAHLDGQKRSHSPSNEVSEIYFKNTFESYE